MKRLVLFLVFVNFLFAQQLWVRRYNGTGNSRDEATAIAVDNSGNVYVTGTSYRSSSYFDYVTIKYDTYGNFKWLTYYNGDGNGDDSATAIKVDNSGNVYVTGISWGSSSDDCATIKHSTNGSYQWVKRYNGPSNDIDKANAIAVDGSGNVYVTGTSYSNTSSFDALTIKYDANGNQKWVKIYDEDGLTDGIRAIAIDNLGNVYVAGWCYAWEVGGFKALTIKYDTSGNQKWAKTFQYYEYASAFAIAVDASGNVYIAGSCSYPNEDLDWLTVKYDANGNVKWYAIYDGLGHGDDGAVAIAVDNSKNVYVTGYSYGGSVTKENYITIKYDSLGNVKWTALYNGPGNDKDIPTAIALHSSGYLYVTGYSYGGSSTNYDYATIKYDLYGNEWWVARYDGPAHNIDIANAIAVDVSGYVYVTGKSVGSGSSYDYATIKYSPVGIEEWTGSGVKKIKLSINPNPCFGDAIISYFLPYDLDVFLKLYDINGELLKTLYLGKKSSGIYKLNLKQDAKFLLKPGIYFIKLSAGEHNFERKLILLK